MHRETEDYGSIVTADPIELDGKVITESDAAEILEEFFDEIFTEAEGKEMLTNSSPEIVFTKYLWVIKKLETEIEKIRITSEKLKSEIDEWESKKTNQKLDQIAYLSNQMENYLRQKELKSLSLPNGNIGLRKQQPKIEIINEEMFYEHAEASLLRHVPESYAPDLTAIKQKIKSTGELPKGVEVTEQDSKFFYKLL
jgi:type I site-specific restriction-modification system R (restriction) subunit